ncbi:MAG: glycosyltransferase family 2 protein, partial [Candidatus Methanomethylicia archaeon]
VFPKISVVIPSFNKVDFVEDTLSSIIKQNYPNLEVVIQDGGSADGTLEVIKKYERKHPSVFKVESKKDKGQLDAINKGLKKTTGEILTYINADDVYEKGAFRKVAEAYLKNKKALWFAGKGRVINEKGKEIAKLATWYKSVLLNINHKSLVIMTNYFIQPSVFITRKAYEKYGPFTGTKTAVMEYDLWLKLFCVSKPVVIPYCLSSFRLYKGSISTSKVKEMMAEDEKIVKKYTSSLFILFLHKLHNKIRLLWV